MKDLEKPYLSKAEEEGEGETGVAVKNRAKRPSRYKVLLHNDDYTTMEFVIEILTKYFQKSHEEAMQVMLEVHNNGLGVCGIYTFEIAETKSQKVTAYARQHGHPLKCTIEKE